MAQSGVQQEVNVINVKEIVGVWVGRQAFTPLQNEVLSQGLGSRGSKSTHVPSNPSMMNHLVIDPFGNFSYSNLTNAKWKIVDRNLIVTTGYGKQMRGFLSPDSVTHEYRLSFEGQLFIREKKIDLDQDKK
ncbi:MAG TPA: hypothetical protein VIT44_14445 [Cyclobacteriaceae bacterium]